MKLKISGKMLKIKDCKLSSARGLMFDDMKDNDGALIYGSSIWMPFVKHELDLLFLNRDFVVLDVQHAKPMKLHPDTWKTYSCKNAKYCLEIKHGVVNVKKLRKGMRIERVSISS